MDHRLWSIVNFERPFYSVQIDQSPKTESMNPWLKYHYFCPSILCYLIATIPMLHMLMAHQFFFKSKFYSCSEEETDYLKFMTPGQGVTNISWYESYHMSHFIWSYHMRLENFFLSILILMRHLWTINILL